MKKLRENALVQGNLRKLSTDLGITDFNAFKRALNKLMNGMPITGKKEAASIAEALRSILFDFNTQKFNKLRNDVMMLSRQNKELDSEVKESWLQKQKDKNPERAKAAKDFNLIRKKSVISLE